jgi:hypothetical protein
MMIAAHVAMPPIIPMTTANPLIRSILSSRFFPKLEAKKLISGSRFA